MAYAITVSLASRRLQLSHYGRVVMTCPVGIGKKGTPTPTGNFRIINIMPHPGGPYGAIWMGLNKPTYGIHGTDNPTSIGGMVSKGCIRLHNSDVVAIARVIPIGTPVTITAH